MSNPILSNNPRSAFAETVTVVAWQTEFDGKHGIAQLHIDCRFDEGRVAGGGEPITFRLNLRRAEVHVVRDRAAVLKFPASSIARSAPATGTVTRTFERQGKVKGAAGVRLDKIGPAASFEAEVSGAVSASEKAEFSTVLGSMDVTYRATIDGYAFVIRPLAGKDRLMGPAWDATKPRLSIQDTGAKRTKGEPPDARVELRCRAEDLIIEDIEFVDTGRKGFLKMNKPKRIAAEQFIKSALANIGFDVGSFDDRFAEFVLADVTPERAAPE